MEATMTILKILSAVFVLAGLAACASDYGQADRRPAYVVAPDSPYPH